MMISMGIGSIVANVQSATFPIRGMPGGWFKDIFLYLSADGRAIPTGAFLLAAVAVICHILLTNTKLGRYTYAIGSNMEAARLSGVDVKKWQMLVYVIAGATAGIGGISYAAIYTTVLPAQGQGFELYAIAAAVIGGTSLSGGVGTIWGTIIGVFIMSVLSTGLPSLNLEAHYQTFFTGRHRHRRGAPGHVPHPEGGGSADRNARGPLQGLDAGEDRGPEKSAHGTRRSRAAAARADRAARPR